jgi:hypothetical protein
MRSFSLRVMGEVESAFLLAHLGGETARTSQHLIAFMTSLSFDCVGEWNLIKCAM